MRKSWLLTLSAMVLSAGVFAQTLLKNDGAMLVIENGATLVVEGGVENVGGGTIDNNGTLEIQGNFLNTATWENGPQVNTVIFSGPNDATVNSGAAIFHHVTMNKGNNGDITLLSDMTLDGVLSFNTTNPNKNNIILGDFDLTIQAAGPGSIAGADLDEYVVTNGLGYLRQEGVGAGETITFPVGFNNTTYNPATLAAVGAHQSDAFSVRALQNVLEDGTSGSAIGQGVADVSWEINEAVIGGSDVNLTLQWALGDELMDFTRASSAVSRHDGAGWDMLFGDLGMAGGTNPYTRVRSNADEFGVFAVGSEKELARALEADLIAYLEGVYVSGTNTQNDALRVSNLVPVTQPYSGLGYPFQGFGGEEETTLGQMNQPANGDDAVDWVIVELRDAGNSSTVVASRAAILQRDGDLVNEDGASMLQIYGVPEGNYFVALRFRNHLGVMTAAPVAFASMGVFDFTTASNAQVFGGSSAMNTAADGKKVLISGDVNYNKIVNNTDITVLAPVAGVGQVNVYSLLDVNMDGIVNNTDVSALSSNAAVGKVEQVPN